MTTLVEGGEIPLSSRKTARRRLAQVHSAASSIRACKETPSAQARSQFLCRHAGFHFAVSRAITAQRPHRPSRALWRNGPRRVRPGLDCAMRPRP
jgi:hypothetical protein